ncbi:TipJ family phage tail tip protein [Citrobacter freundii]
MTTTIIKGRGKGGSNQTRTPVEAPDSIQSIARAKVLIALGEGEFAGGLDGKNIFLGDSSSYTPLQNADGSYNFNNVKYEFRSGTQDQDYIQGFPGIENELQVSYELKQAVPYVRAVSNTQLSALRIRLGWPTLLLQKNNGDKVGTRVEYAIDLSVDGGPYETVINGAVDDKTTSLYERSHRVNLPKASTGWQLRVRRITPDSTSVNVVDIMRVVAVTEIIDAKLRYVNTALLYVEFDAKQFPNGIPQVVCNPKGRIIRVPDTYDPETRTYSGTWEGVFKWAWTDNPAWIYYDIILNERFGLGQRIDATQIDKWELYRIAQYCDQPVPDGRGGSGTEPRFRCNVYIQDRNDAWTVLRDLAGIFRGMAYWGDNKMYVLADMPRDVWHIYNHSSVVEGKFTFADPSETTRNTAALVNWSDPANHYKDTPEPVYDNDLAMRFDYRQLEMTAIGCTRQSEANRRGRWALLTNGIGEVVTFSTGMDVPPVGEVIGVAANELAGRTIGGRVSAVNGRNITLDRAADVKAGNRLFLNLPSGIAQARTVQAVNGNTVTVTTSYSETPEAECNWGVDSDDLFIALFRVTGTRDNNDGTFEVTGTTYNPDIYPAVDTGARLDERPISVIPPGVQTPPGNIVVDSYSTVNQNIAITTMRVAWDAVQGAVAYEAEWRRDSGNWVTVPRTSSLGFEVQGIYSGRYLVRVRAVNTSDVSSVWAISSEVNLTGKVGNPPKPVGFATTPINWGIRLNWGFPANTGDTLKTEIQYTANSDFSNPLLLSDVPYPSAEYTQLGLKAGQEFWYRAQLVDRTGNESGWTDWVRGVSNANADDYLGDIADDFLTSADGDRLTGDIDTNLEAALQNALANHGTVEHQFAQYGEVRADILVVKTTIAQVDKAMAEMSTQVQAQFNDVTAALEDKLTAVVDATGASAIYTLKTGVRINGVMYNAGMSIAVLAEAGKPVVTRVGFNANQFVLMSGSGDTQYSPFAVVNGQVFISDAFIQNGSITSAKIGNYIQSNNYVTGSVGWHINKNGNSEFNNVTVRGTIYGNDGYFNGTIRANKIDGDVCAVWTFPEMSIVRGDGRSQTLYWRGGLNYPARICIPYSAISMGVSRSDNQFRVQLTINGVVMFDETFNNATSILRNVVGYVDVPAGAVNVPITVNVWKVQGGQPNTLYFTVNRFAVIVSPATDRFFS